MKTAVMYGAGNIGRGFIGQLFCMSGYETCFLDIDPFVLSELQRRRSYPVRIVSNESCEQLTVQPVRAVNAASDQAAEEIAHCAVMATAVGVRVLPAIAPVLAEGFRRRMLFGGEPLNILICENQMNAPELLRGLIYAALPEDLRSLADEKLGLVEVSVGRMVPRPTPDLRAEDPLLICEEPYCDLPVDRAGFRGEIPQIKGMIPFEPFDYYIRRKLFLHNGSHMLCAALGYKKGYSTISRAMEDPEIASAVKKHMDTIVQCLGACYGPEALADAAGNAEDLRHRFRNRVLGDTTLRVAADPMRKLRRDDRITGAIVFAMENGIDPAPLMPAFCEELYFFAPEDASSVLLKNMLDNEGIGSVLTKVVGIDPAESLFTLLKNACRR